MRNARIATAGEALIDLMNQADGLLRPCLGGAAYNLSRALGRQGLALAYLNPFSQDRFGVQLAEQLAREGVSAANHKAVPQPTSLAVIALDARGKPSYSFYREGVADRSIGSEDLIASCQEMPALEVVATGCLALSPDDQNTYQSWLAACRGAGVAVVIDINLRPAVISDATAYRRSVLKAMAYADLIKASDEDLEFLFNGLGDPLQAAQALFELSPTQWVCLTLGSEGAYLMARDGRSWHGQNEAKLNIADTVGAGDCFLGGLMSSFLGDSRQSNLLLNSSPVPASSSLASSVPASSQSISDAQAAAALTRAIASASHCIEQIGCEPPTKQQVAARVAQGTIKIQAFASGQTPVR
jgi:fructokinase